MKKGFDLEMKVAGQDLYVRGEAIVDVVHEKAEDNMQSGTSHKVNRREIYIETINDITPNYFDSLFLRLIKWEIKEQIEQGGVLL